MATRYLIETNVIIDYSLNKLNLNGKNFIAKIIDNFPVISVINKIELLGFSIVTSEIKEFVSNSHLIDLSNKITEQTIELRKKHKIKIPDAIIAATAIVNKLTLITRNDKDFKNISELKMINPNNL